jgi:hypothetical protein
MNIQVKKVEDFLRHLTRIGSQNIFDSMICAERTERVVQADDRGDTVKGEVFFQAHAVIVDDYSYHLILSESCGIDYMDSENDRHGSQRADEIEKQLLDFCTKAKLILEPGVIQGD